MTNSLTAAPEKALPAIGGDPCAIRESGFRWRALAQHYERAAGDVRICRTSSFEGDEGVLFNAALGGFGSDLDRASGALHAAAAALLSFADALEHLQRRQTRLNDDWMRNSRTTEASASDTVQQLTDATGAASLSSRWRAESQAVRFEHADAVRACRARLAEARSLIPKITPTRPGLPDGPNIVPDRRDGRFTASLVPRYGASSTWSLGGRPPGSGGGSSERSDGGSSLRSRGGSSARQHPAPSGELALMAALVRIAAGTASLFGLMLQVRSIVPGEVSHALAMHNRAGIPPDILQEIDEAIARARTGKRRFEKHDGKIWEDRKHQLPVMPRGYYREWTAADPHAKRGAHRVIIGGDPQNPDVIYYWDHSENRPILIGP